MGTCWNCSKEVFLKEEETRCDNCGEIVRYWCNTCKVPFDVQDEDNNKVRECKWCWFFLCPNCDACSPDCEKYEHLKKIKEIIPTCSALNKFHKRGEHGDIQGSDRTE